MNHRDWILTELKKGRTLTSWDCIQEIGCTRAPARIMELKAKGYPIQKRMVTGKNRFGIHTAWAEYWMRKES